MEEDGAGAVIVYVLAANAMVLAGLVIAVWRWVR